MGGRPARPSSWPAPVGGAFPPAPETLPNGRAEKQLKHVEESTGGRGGSHGDRVQKRACVRVRMCVCVGVCVSGSGSVGRVHVRVRIEQKT